MLDNTGCVLHLCCPQCARESSRIAPCFGISRRFVGTEPCCPLTGGYNEAMTRILPVFGIDVVEIERKQIFSGVISASRVREIIGNGDLSGLEPFVPPTTLAYLTSDEAEPIRKQLQMKTGVAI